MASHADNGSRPSISGSAISVRTAGGTELHVNDPWTARILVTTMAGVGAYIAHGFVTFLHEHPSLVRYAVKVAFKAWGQVKDVKFGSIIVDLDCGSEDKFSKFKQDFEDEKVKDALEAELKEIGCDAKLELKLKETPNVAMIEISKKTMTEETRKILFANPNPEEEKESDQEAASGSTEIKREKTLNYKEGVVTDDDLQKLGKAIGGKWDRLARRLPGIKNEEIEGIDETVKKLPDKGYHILNQWKSKDEKTANYENLYNALAHDLVGRKDLAEKYCLKNNIS